MYNAILLILLGSAIILVISGLSKGKNGRIVAGILVGLLTIFFFWVLDFWGEYLWFAAIEQGQRFWTLFLSESFLAVLGALLSGVIVYILTLAIPEEKKIARIGAPLLGALIGGVWGTANWEVILKFWHRTAVGVADPILGKDASFYLFSLPFYERLYTLLIILAVLSLVAILFATFFRIRGGELELQLEGILLSDRTKLFRWIYIIAAIIVFLLAVSKFLNRYHLMYSTWGAVTGPGWTDVQIRLPGYAIVILITVLSGIALLLPPIRIRISQMFRRSSPGASGNPITPLIVIGAAMLLIWFLALTAVPGLFQWLRVEPNEITFEKPYIANNIEFTRHGFNLHNVEEREFPASARFSEQMVQENRNLFSNIRLWDWRALDAVYKQFQEIRLYYEFADVDIDRYSIGNAYRQVMVSAREMDIGNLPAQSQTFVNERFKYTHGYGITLTNVSEFTPEGLPQLLIKDIPPKSAYPELEVTQPQIYYGELTNTHVIVNSTEEEFDYPSGDKNVYTRYSGDGGVQLSNLWRKFLFGWKFDGTRLFLSGYPTNESRILFHRQINERVKTLAPFLHFEDDPYIVLVEGELYWIIDAYTTSQYFPYSEPFASQEIIEYKEGDRQRVALTEVGSHFHGKNYIRNSVKTVVNAHTGAVDFYIFDEEDAIIKVWDKIFPDLFKDKSELPERLRQHTRYPVNMLLIQGLVYAKYHMNDPTVFYNQEDLWIRATEKYYDQVRPVEPYYVMWELPGSDDPEFTLILPFTPKNRQVMIGWIAGMCDGENYGRFLAYKFPKERRVLGPQQVETKIDQDSYLSGQLTLWDQRGSNVIRGNVLAIPIEETLIYVEPIYLQAETAAYPELRLVVVMHEDNLSYAETFDEALQGLFEGQSQKMLAKEEPAEMQISINDLTEQANTAFENYLKFLGEKQFGKASNALTELQQTLQTLSEMTASGAKEGNPQ